MPKDKVQDKAQGGQDNGQAQVMDARIVELARKLGIADPQALMTVASAFTEALTVEERNFEATRQAIVEAIGDYRGFTTITVTNKDGELTVERSTGKAKAKATNGTGNGGYEGSGQSFQGIDVSLSGELQAKYHLAEATYKSRRQLAHAIAGAQGKEPPADNAVPRWLKANAQDVWEHVGKPTS